MMMQCLRNQIVAKKHTCRLLPLSTEKRRIVGVGCQSRSHSTSFSVIARRHKRDVPVVSSLGRPVCCRAEDGTDRMQRDASDMTLWDQLCVFSDRISMNFAWIVLCTCSFSLFVPAPFLWFTSECVSVALAISMLAMGCTLKLKDFAILAQHPFRIIAGVLLQYTIMPLTGFGISRLARLPSSLAAGIVLVSCCPGGVASNIVTYLAGGDVALSVAMTSVSTLLAIFLTPVLTAMLIGTLVPVDAWALFSSTVQVHFTASKKQETACQESRSFCCHWLWV